MVAPLLRRPARSSLRSAAPTSSRFLFRACLPASERSSYGSSSSSSSSIHLPGNQLCHNKAAAAAAAPRCPAASPRLASTPLAPRGSPQEQQRVPSFPFPRGWGGGKLTKSARVGCGRAAAASFLRERPGERQLINYQLAAGSVPGRQEEKGRARAAWPGLPASD